MPWTRPSKLYGQRRTAPIPAQASRVIREFYGDLYYRTVRKLEGGPKPPDWSSAEDATFERARKMIRTHDWTTEEIAETLRERLAERTAEELHA